MRVSLNIERAWVEPARANVEAQLSRMRGMGGCLHPAPARSAADLFLCRLVLPAARPVQSSRRARGDLGTSSGNGRRRRIGYDEPEPEIDGETVPQPSTSGRIFGSRRRGDGDGARAPAEASWEDGRDPGGSGRARDRSGRGERGRDGAERERTRERERDKSSGRRRDAPRGDAPPEETRLLPNGARPARWRCQRSGPPSQTQPSSVNQWA